MSDTRWINWPLLSGYPGEDRDGLRLRAQAISGVLLDGVRPAAVRGSAAVPRAPSPLADLRPSVGRLRLEAEDIVVSVSIEGEDVAFFFKNFGSTLELVGVWSPGA